MRVGGAAVLGCVDGDDVREQSVGGLDAPGARS